MKSKAVLLSGGNLNNGSNAGVGYLNTNNSSSNSNWNICAIFCNVMSLLFIAPPLGETHNYSPLCAGSSRERSGLTKAIL
jgi:hypothetical protein